jgi:hypothetical protein
VLGAAGGGFIGGKVGHVSAPLREFGLDRVGGGGGLGCVIGVAGWLAPGAAGGAVAQWGWLPAALPGTECLALRWDSPELEELGRQFGSFVREKGGYGLASTAAQEAMVGLEFLEYAAVEALAWPVALLTAANYIDNAWTVVTNRARKAGVALAHWLVRRWHEGSGESAVVGPVTLGLGRIVALTLSL